MSTDNTEGTYSLYIDDKLEIVDSTELNCKEKLNETFHKYQNLYLDRTFVLDNYDNFFRLVSYPKNYPTSYERLDFTAYIVNEI